MVESTEPAMITVRMLAERYDTFIFDCDGVIWNSNGEIGHAFRAIEWLESMGKNVFFVTNKTSKTSIECVNKMKGMGYTGAKESHTYTMATVTSKYIKRKLPEVRKVFVIGFKAIRDSLEEQGIEVIGAD